MALAPGYIDVVNTPSVIGARCITGHSPAQPAGHLNGRQVNDSCYKTFRVAAPSLTTGNRTTAISANGAVIAAHKKATASGENILKRVSAVSTQFQYPAVKAKVGIGVRRLEVQVVPES
jgi:hypothetical protein